MGRPVVTELLEGFSGKRPLERAELGAVSDSTGVHVVWDSDGHLLFVGLSSNTRKRLGEHLRGDREASVLHQKVGRLLDTELGRVAEATEIEAWLSNCSFQWVDTERPRDLKAQLMAALNPRFNEVSPLPEATDSQVDLRALFSEVMGSLQQREPGAPAAATPYRLRVVEELPTLLRTLIPSDYAVKGSVGYGSSADVPWVSITHADEYGTAREGVYAVYLFAADGSRVYLALSQGVSSVAGGTTVLAKRARDLRDVISAQSGWQEEIDLRSSNPLPSKYAAATAYAVAYDVQELPSHKVLLRDLESMLEALRGVEAAGLAEPAENEPLHLVMKWSKEIRSDTIAQHKRIAETRGSVWWGKFGTPGTNAIGKARLELIRKQLDDGIETFAFLYRNGELWRTRLLRITPKQEDIDLTLLPDYYSPEDSILFLELTDFEEIHPPTWALSHLLLASDPDPAKTQGALSNQTSPVFVYLRGSVPDDDSARQAASRSSDFRLLVGPAADDRAPRHGLAGRSDALPARVARGPGRHASPTTSGSARGAARHEQDLDRGGAGPISDAG